MQIKTLVCEEVFVTIFTKGCNYGEIKDKHNHQICKVTAVVLNDKFEGYLFEIIKVGVSHQYSNFFADLSEIENQFCFAEPDLFRQWKEVIFNEPLDLSETFDNFKDILLLTIKK